MGIGEGVGLRVDPELLSKLGTDLETAAAGLPDAPEAFVVSGTDPISLAIAGRLPDVEGSIQQALPQVKADATTTASNVISAAGAYKGTDENLAAEYEKHQFDQGGGSTTGDAARADGGSGGGADAMSQMMSMPMQMAGQAAQMPMQAMGAVAAAPQAAMQAWQQIGQMVGGLGTSDDGSQDARPDELDERSDDERKQESQPDAAAGPARAERAPDVSAASAVSQQGTAADTPN